MCTGKCAKFIGSALYPLALFSIIANILLLFPNFEVEYLQETGKLTPEILYLGGILGGGIAVLFPAIHIHATGNGGCCANRCGMFLSILFSTLGVVGAAYCLATSSLGLINGPMCLTGEGNWSRPFSFDSEDLNLNFSDSEDHYLSNSKIWDLCKKPQDVVLFNMVLFILLICFSVIELVLCLVQMVNGFFGCICGTCGKRRAGPV
ncbi:transmembrane 4 L6 family member 5 [Mustelus asterias]